MTTVFMLSSGLFSPYSSLSCIVVCLRFLEEENYAASRTMVLVTCSYFHLSQILSIYFYVLFICHLPGEGRDMC